jgi:hypothetical protein
LKSQLPNLMKSLQKEIKGKNINIRLRSYDLLSNLIRFQKIINI